MTVVLQTVGREARPRMHAWFEGVMPHLHSTADSLEPAASSIPHSDPCTYVPHLIHTSSRRGVLAPGVSQKTSVNHLMVDAGQQET